MARKNDDSRIHNRTVRWAQCVAAARRSAKLLVVCLFAMVVSVGCASTGAFPHSTGTQVGLDKKNYRLVKANAIGQSSGFSLLGIIPIVPPTYTAAMSSLYETSGMETGAAQALVNVTQERSSLYLVLFSVPRLTVRADIIEFTD